MTSIPDKEPLADAIIIDGAALVNSLRPSTGSTFESYAMDEVLPKLHKYANELIIILCMNLIIMMIQSSKSKALYPLHQHPI